MVMNQVANSKHDYALLSVYMDSDVMILQASLSLCCTVWTL